MFKTFFIYIKVYINNQILKYAVSLVVLTFLLKIMLHFLKYTAISYSFNSITPLVFIKYLFIGSICLYIIKKCRLQSQIGFTKKNLIAASISSICTVLLYFIYVLVKSPPPQLDTNFRNILLLCYNAVFVSIIEELQFRGLLLNLFQQMMKPLPSIMLVSLSFALLHFDNGLWNIVYVLMINTAWTALRFISRNIAGCIILHSGFNSINLYFFWDTKSIPFNIAAANLFLTLALVFLLYCCTKSNKYMNDKSTDTKENLCKHV